MTATHSPRASLADVARLAGVSSQTVSRVVRDIGVVAPATRARVLKAVNELGYVPNIAARSLSQRRTNVIHIVNATPLFHGHARTFLALVSVLTERGYHTSIAEAPQGVEAPSLDQLVPIGVDGLILLGGHDRSLSLVESVAGRLPVVFVGQIDGLPEAVASVGIDQFCGAAMATTHLLELQHDPFMHLLDTRPELAKHMLRALAQRLRRTNEALADLVFSDVPGRVATGTSSPSVDRAIFDALIAVNGDDEFEGFLAESIEPNDDNTVWTMTLKDWKFTDGTDVTADDGQIGRVRAEHAGDRRVVPQPVRGRLRLLTAAGPESGSPLALGPGALGSDRRTGRGREALIAPRSCDFPRRSVGRRSRLDKGCRFRRVRRVMVVSATPPTATTRGVL